jgi:signal transduction histidine kinase
MDDQQRAPDRRKGDRRRRADKSTDEHIQALLRRVITAQEDERRRISRDIHDHLGQQLTALRMNLEVFRLQCGLDASRLKQLARTQYLAEELDRSIDFLTWQLRPAALELLGLPGALRQLTSTWSERLQLEVCFQSTLKDGHRFERDVEDNLFRIAQEALHNVLKHAEPRRVSVSLSHDTEFVSLSVEDEGCGFDYEKTSAQSDDTHGLGLTSMRERAALIGGTLVVDSEPGIGTSVVVRIPFAVVGVSN